MIDNIFVLYENAGKYFNTYEEAWKNHYNSHIKKVKYVFTPTMQHCKNVGELEKICRLYFQNAFDVDYLDVLNHYGYKQMRIIGDVK